MNKNSLLLAAITAALALTGAAQADVSDRLYDFTDAYYLRNGIDPTKIGGRRQAVLPNAVESKPIFSFQRNVRALITFGGWDHSGHDTYFTIMGGFSAAAFTPNSAGANARAVADRAPEYVFPMKGTNPTGLGAVRQPFMLDMRNGYFSNNPLGLWIHVWINYTDKAFNTTTGKSVLAELGRRNGLALDGTPMIRSQSDIDNLYSKGLITKTTVPLDSPIRYGICPVIKDPTDGGIAEDQFLITPRREDGSPLIRSIQRNFDSLRMTGDWWD